MRRTKGFLVLLLSVVLLFACTTIAVSAEVSDSDVAKIGDTGYASLKAAITAVETDGTAEIVLLKDYSGADFISYSKKNITFDLNGHSYARTNSGAAIQVGANATFTLKDSVGGGSFNANNGIGIETKAATAVVNVESGTVSGTNYGISSDNGTVTVNDGNIIGGKIGIYTKSANITVSGGTVTGDEQGILDYENAKPATITVTGGTIKATGTTSDTGAIVLQDASTLSVSGDDTKLIGGHSGIAVFDAANVTVNGGSVRGDSFGITGNGSEGYSGYTIDVKGGTVSAQDGVGIYHPNDGALNISGGTVTGKTAVYQKAGTLNITGGTIKGTGASADYSYNGNGANATGDAVVIDNCGYPGGAPAPEITGGTFVSEHAAPVASYAYPEEGDDAKTPVGGFVSGGTFSGEINGSLCEEGFVLKANADDTYGVAELAPIQWFYTWSVPNIYYFADENPVPSRTTQGTVPTIKREGESSYHAAEDFVTVTWTVTASDAEDASTPDDSIATVDENGLVTFSKPGKVKVWLTMTDSAGTKSASKAVSYALAPAVVKHGDTKTAYATVSAALNHAEDGDTVILGADANANNIGKVELKADKDLTLDLNGHKISFSQNYSTSTFGAMFNIKKGSLTVVNSGNGGGIFASGTNARAFNIDGTANESADDATLTISEGVVVSSANDSCVTVFGKGTLNTAGDLTSAADFVIAGNGSAGKEGYVINVTGGSVTSETQTAIYHPNQGTVNVSGGTITGATGIYQKAGTLNITGGTITGNGEKAAYTYNGDGANATGDAVVIDNCGYPGGAPAPEITGGTFVSEHAAPVASYAYPAEGDGAKEPVVGFVAGGAYSGVLPDEYCADDFIQATTANDNGLYGIVDAVTVTFDADGGTPAPKAQKIEKGAKAGKPDTDPDKNDFIFTGWFATGSESPFDFDTVINANTVLTAHWISILDKAKADAIDELNKIDVDSYIESHQYKVHQLVEAAKTNVKAAETVEEVGEIMDAFKSNLAKYTTLETAKENAKEELANYKKDVEFAEADARGAIVAEGLQAIDDATTSDEVSKALVDAKKAIDELPTKDTDDKAKAKKALEDAVTAATEQINGDVEYTDESKAAVQAAIAEANEVLGDAEATTRQYNKAKAALDAAVDALVTKADADAAAAAEAAAKEKAEAKQALEDLIAEAQAKAESDYTAGSWTEAGLAAAITAAQEVFEDEASDKAAYEDATAALQAKLDKLVTTKAGAKKALEDAVTAATEQINGDVEYTAESKAAVQAAIAEANEVLEDAEATTRQYNKAKAALDEAVAALVTKADADSQALAEAKEKAKTALAGYKDPADYREAEQSELNDAVANGTNAIESADSIDAVTNALAEAKATIDALKTAEQYEDEEAAAAASALAQAKIDALAELDGYKDPADYRDAEKVALRAINVEAREAIYEAASIEEVEAAITAAKVELDKVKTNAQYEVEEAAAAAQALADAKSAAIATLDNIDTSNYSAENAETVAGIVSDAKTAVEGATTPEAVSQILNDVANSIKDIPTNKENGEAAAQALKKAQNDAITTINETFANAQDKVLEADKNAVELESMNAKINALTATTPEQADAAAQNYILTVNDMMADKEAVAPVIDMINNLPAPAGVVPSDQDAIAAAGEAYNTLNDLQKGKISDSLLEKLQGDEQSIKDWEQYNSQVAAAKKIKATISSANPGAYKKAVVKWNKSNGVSGYQVRYSTNSKFNKDVKNVKVNKVGTVKANIAKLAVGSTYYVQVRTYKNIKNKVTGKTAATYGAWSGTKKFVEMEKAKITSAKAKKGKKVVVKWKKTKGINGYQIRYSTDKKFKKGVKKTKVNKAKTTKRTIKKLKAGKTYYVQVRTFKKVKGKTVYGKWSASKKFKALK